MICRLSHPIPRLWRRVAFAASFITVVGRAHGASAQTNDGSVSATLTLRALLDSVRANPAVRAAESRVRAAEGSRVSARAFGNPVLSYQVDQTPFPGGRPLIGMDREAMTTATFPLEGFYQRGARGTRANADVRAAEADAAAVRQRIGLDAAAAYYRAAIAQVQFATTRDLVAWLDTLVTYNRSRVNEGVAAEADLIRSELERDRMSAEASMQNAELAQARAALSAFLSDRRTTDELPLVTAYEMPLPFPASVLPQAAAAPPPTNAVPFALSIDARPDVRAARERVTAATAGIAVERSMFFRQLGATIGAMQSAGTTSMIAGISVPVPLFDPNRGEIQRAHAERDAVTFELAARERTATAELRGAYEAARILTERTATLARRDSVGFLARADESRRNALGAYREGAAPLFQVIDAARAWMDARMTYYRTIFAQHQSILTMIVADGLDLFAAAPSLIPPGGTPR